LDEYDQWLFGPEGLWPATPGTEKVSFPDVLIIEAGHSTCLHATEPNRAASELHLDDETVNQHQAQMKPLLDAVKTAIARPTDTARRTTVIVSTAPRVGAGNPKADRCVYKTNRILAREAHRHGFVVLEREEIEIT